MTEASLARPAGDPLRSGAAAAAVMPVRGRWSLARFARLALGPLIVAVGVVALVWTAGLSIASAQAAEAEWAFAPLGLFGDERVRHSMRLQMDAAAGGDAGGVPLEYHDGTELPPAEHADLLLFAAGVVSPDDGRAHVIIERPCRVWTAEGLEPAGEALGAELSRVWARYQVQFPPCDATDDPTLADILVFPSGAPPAEVDLNAHQALGSFLSVAPFTPGASNSDAAAGSGGTPVDPTPAQGGSLGGEDSDDPVALAVALAVAAAVVVGGRLLTGTAPGQQAKRTRMR